MSIWSNYHHIINIFPDKYMSLLQAEPLISQHCNSEIFSSTVIFKWHLYQNIAKRNFQKLLFNLLAFLFLESKIIELTKYVQWLLLCLLGKVISFWLTLHPLTSLTLKFLSVLNKWFSRNQKLHSLVLHHFRVFEICTVALVNSFVWGIDSLKSYLSVKDA